MTKKQNEVTLNLLNKDLDMLTKYIALSDQKIIKTQKALIKKLNNNKLDEVIHNLFTKNDILKFLANSGISVGIPIKKDALIKPLKEGVFEFPRAIFNKIDNIEETQANKNEGKIQKTLSKYDIEFDNDGDLYCDSNPKLESYIKKHFKANIPEFTSYTSIFREDSKLNIKITHELENKEITLKGSIDSSDMQIWCNDHFLIKDLGNGMATLEVDY